MAYNALAGRYTLYTYITELTFKRPAMPSAVGSHLKGGFFRGEIMVLYEGPRSLFFFAPWHMVNTMI